MNLENCTIFDYLVEHDDVLAPNLLSNLMSDLRSDLRPGATNQVDDIIKNITMPNDELINRYRFNYIIKPTKKGHIANLYSDYLNTAVALCYAVIKTQNLTDMDDWKGWDALETLVDDNEETRVNFEDSLHEYLTTVVPDNSLKGSYDLCYEGAKQWVINQQQNNGILGTYENNYDDECDNKYGNEYGNDSNSEDESGDDYRDESGKSRDSDDSDDSDD